MASEKVVLLNFTASPYATRVRVALAEKEVPYEAQEEDLFGNKSPLFLQMNLVLKLVPVLIHNGKPICKFLNIVQYIDEAWDEKSPLLPSDPQGRANARFWAITSLTPSIILQIFDTAKTFWTSEGEVQANLRVVEGEPGEKHYFGGESFGFMVLALIPVFSFFQRYESLGKVEEEWPKPVAWANKCMEKTSVSNSMCDQKKVYEAVMEIRKMVGVE